MDDLQQQAGGFWRQGMQALGLMQFEPAKIKPHLVMARTRFELVRTKRERLLKGQRREVAALLAEDPPAEAKARLRAEGLVNQDYTLEAYENLALMCEARSGCVVGFWRTSRVLCERVLLAATHRASCTSAVAPPWCPAPSPPPQQDGGGPDGTMPPPPPASPPAPPRPAAPALANASRRTLLASVVSRPAAAAVGAARARSSTASAR